MITSRGALRICVIIPSLGDGGAQRQCIALLNELQDHPQLEMHLILLAEGEHEWRLRRSNLTIHRVSVQNFASYRALAFVARVLSRTRPDIAMSWLHPADLLTSLAKHVVPSTKWVMTERDSAYPHQLKYRLRTLLGRRADLTIANSQAGARYWRSHAPFGEVKVIENIVLVDRNHVERDPVTDTVLYVGRLEPQKNCELLLRGFAEFAAQHPKAKLRIVGRGSQEELLRQLAGELGVTRRVEFVGFVKDVQREMNVARVLATTSQHEGMPNVMLEAIATGLPILASDIPEHRAILGPAYEHFVSREATPDEVAAQMSAVWADVSAVDRLAFARSAIENMTPAAIGERYAMAFQKLVERSLTTSQVEVSNT